LSPTPQDQDVPTARMGDSTLDSPG
jgi:hypothetical protein